MKRWMKSVGACYQAVEWVADRTPAQAWAECPRPDWMFWALGKTSVDLKEMVALACDIAASVCHLSNDPRVLAAVKAAKGWCEDLVDSEECRIAARAAATAADIAYAAYDAAAADAAAAAYVAYTAATAANSANRADATAYVTTAADYAGAAYATDVAARAYVAGSDSYTATYDTARKEFKTKLTGYIRARISPQQFSELVTR